MSLPCLVLLPIHLFDINIVLQSLETLNLSNLKDIYILEEPVYFGDRDAKLNFTKLKLIYHRASMKYYYDYLTDNKSISRNTIINNAKITYINYNECKKKTNIQNTPYKTITQAHSKVYMFDPVDTYLEAKYSNKKCFGNKIEYIDSPLFLCSNKNLEEYHKSKPKPDSYTHASFYKWQKTRLHILEKEKTYDTENRNQMPLDTKIPPLPKNDASNSNCKYLIEAIEYIEKEFSNNLEPIYVSVPVSASAQNKITPKSIHFPITHKSSILWLEHFCKNRLEKFGEYEDSIDSIPRNFLFHSTISPMINIGLITPLQIITIVSKYYEKNKEKIGIATYEGFIRQVIGWREYQRYIYKYIGDKMRNSNHFNNTRKLSEHWYKATTGIKPVDDAIMLAINDGYIHHILRLMVVGNFMNLVGITPDEVYKWFMEFAMDSYDWVMIGNVYSMALWADGGLTMRKPYISGDGYIMKMGNYTNSKSKSKNNNNTNWNSIWNTIFHHFIDRNQEKLSKTYYNGIVKAWSKKPKTEKEKELVIANTFINNYSH